MFSSHPSYLGIALHADTRQFVQLVCFSALASTGNSKSWHSLSVCFQDVQAMEAKQRSGQEREDALRDKLQSVQSNADQVWSWSQTCSSNPRCLTVLHAKLPAFGSRKGPITSLMHLVANDICPLLSTPRRLHQAKTTLYCCVLPCPRASQSSRSCICGLFMQIIADLKQQLVLAQQQSRLSAGAPQQEALPRSNTTATAAQEKVCTPSGQVHCLLLRLPYPHEACCD